MMRITTLSQHIQEDGHYKQCTIRPQRNTILNCDITRVNLHQRWNRCGLVVLLLHNLDYIFSYNLILKNKKAHLMYNTLNMSTLKITDIQVTKQFNIFNDHVQEWIRSLNNAFEQQFGELYDFKQLTHWHCDYHEMM
jgi:hypothetical protein